MHGTLKLSIVATVGMVALSVASLCPVADPKSTLVVASDVSGGGAGRGGAPFAPFACAAHVNVDQTHAHALTSTGPGVDRTLRPATPEELAGAWLRGDLASDLAEPWGVLDSADLHAILMPWPDQAPGLLAGRVFLRWALLERRAAE